MEIKFQDKLKYQQDAINSAVDLFKGHPNPNDLSPISIRTPGMVDTIEGKANLWDIDPISIEENFYEVQKNNRIPINKSLNSYDFTIEMETGTGKTYVYLRTILELNKHYGFSKFVIVVPSVAIREGVKKTIDITRKHFSELYNGVSYSDFIFNSSNMSELETFMEEDNIQIMIITIQAFSREENKINQKMENGVIPIQYITKTNPIVIIDEPQSTASTQKQKDAISNLNPIFTLQYSATPKDISNLIYKLDAVDAYNRNLVKKIEVNAFDAADYQGKPYIRLNSVKLNKRSGKRTAEITVVKNTKTGLNTTLAKNIKIGDDLSVSRISNNSVYEDYIVKDIGVKEGEEFISFDNGQKVSLGQSINDINQEAVRRDQLKETIREHLKKELKLSKKNIKVLSLFFIDRVEKYRVYDDEGYHNGIYADWFEKAYNEVLAEDDIYKNLPNYILNVPAHKVHNGYFSGDKKWVNTSGETKADDSAYEKIMRNKEKLLNPKDKLRFIFSHSALKEGWDNPNVFQICTFIDTQSDLSKRQKIGRGLRLCVDGDGNRIDESYGNGDEFKTINRLTVLANESFDSFANSLQKEMEADGIEFHKLNVNAFNGLSYIRSDGEHVQFDKSDSEKIWKSLFEQGFLDKKGTITKEWKSVVKDNNLLKLPEQYIEAKSRIIEFVSSKNGNIIENAGNRKTFNIKKEKLDEPEFNNLWNKINYKSNYTVSFDRDILIENCVEGMKESLWHIQKTVISHTRHEVKLTTGVEGITKSKTNHFVETENNDIPNIVNDLQSSTHLDKQTIIDILIKSNEKFKSFEKLLINPTEFYNRTLEVIKDNLNHLMVKNIQYYKLEGQEFDSAEFKEFFEDWIKNENYLERHLVKSDKSIYEYIKCDSDVEVKFAQELENVDEIEFFLKLPSWFKIKTPNGHYNPDWAITVNINGKSETFFVIETKGTNSLNKLRTPEADNIRCGVEHFKLDSDVEYDFLKSFDDFSYRYIHEN